MILRSTYSKYQINAEKIEAREYKLYDSQINIYRKLRKYLLL
jgi:hypothetical protein